MVAGTLATIGSYAIANAGAIATLTGTGLAVNNAIYQADADKAERTREGNAISEQKETALTQRKSLIDKQRLQLMGAGDGKFKTKRTVGMGTGDVEVLG